MAHKSVKCKMGAYFALKEADGDFMKAQRIYNKWLPADPVSKWRQFARRCETMFDDPANCPKLATRGVGGRKPRLSDKMVLKIGTVYTQTWVWSKGEKRHYRDLHEVRASQRAARPCRLLLPPAPSPTRQLCLHPGCCCWRRLARVTPCSRPYAASPASALPTSKGA